jgi:hypothetical protein
MAMWNTSVLGENYYTSIITHSENLPVHQRKQNGEPTKGKGVPWKKKIFFALPCTQHLICIVHKIQFYIPETTCNLHYKDHVILGNNQYLVNGTCLPCLVVQDQSTLPTSCIRPRTNNSSNCQCDNFEPQEAWITELLRMYGPSQFRLVMV